MRRLIVGTLAALFIAGVGLSVKGEAQDPKVEICHYPAHDGDFLPGDEEEGGPKGGWEAFCLKSGGDIIEISSNACEAHLGKDCSGKGGPK